MYKLLIADSEWACVLKMHFVFSEGVTILTPHIGRVKHDSRPDLRKTMSLRDNNTLPKAAFPLA
ncbi:hypothetical protein [Massilia sp. TWR1-2-2]|uniref:hypothetical protein n=1 Tax=Massilia sp. TWR1-2-2 TaxID=2804584 RepID=UPI003CF7112B